MDSSNLSNSVTYVKNNINGNDTIANAIYNALSESVIQDLVSQNRVVEDISKRSSYSTTYTYSFD